MKYIALIFLSLLSGCSYISQETYLDATNTSQWQSKKTEGLVSFSTTCDTGLVYVGFYSVLKADKGAYFFLFIPIGSAHSLSQAAQSVDIHVRYATQPTECSSSDVVAVIDNTSFLPTSASQSERDPSACSYKFKPTFGQNGSWVLQFKKPNFCPIPDLNLIYKTEEKLKYDKMQG